MSSFEIDFNFNKEISLNLICVDCECEFSTELDTDFSSEILPFSGSGVLNCHDCDKEYQYVIKIDSGKFQINFREDSLAGNLEYSTKISPEEFKTSSPLKSKRFYFLQIERLEKIISLETSEYIVNQTINRLVFSGIITSLETFLNEIYLSIVFYSSDTFEQFVSSYEPYRKESIQLNEIYINLSKLQNRVKEDINAIVFHNIGKVIKLFNIFDFELEKFHKINVLAKHVQTRHNFIHKSGIDENNNFQEIRKYEVLSLMNDSNEFVEYVFKKFEDRCFLPYDEDFPF